MRGSMRIKFVQLTQKIKLKKNNIYFMHFVQPATAMLPDVLQSARYLAPNRSTVAGHTVPGRGVGLCCRNPSFIIKSENRDAELPTERQQEGKKAGEQHVNLFRRRGQMQCRGNILN